MTKIIVICCDSLRYDALSLETTPNLLRIAKDGTLFTNAYSCGSITPLSMPYMLCGSEVFNTQTSIQSKIKKLGYRSKLLTTNFDPVYQHFRYGFDEAYYKPDLKNGHANEAKRRLGWFIDKHFPAFLRRWMHQLYTRIFGKPIGYYPAEEMFRFAMPMIEDDKTFIWIHLMDPHIPYSPQPNKRYNKRKIYDLNTKLLNAVWLKGKLKDDEKADIKELYRLNVFEMDQAIGAFYDLVKNGSIFVVLSDHGDEHGEDGFNWGHKGHRVNDVLRHIPFIVAGNGVMGVNFNRVSMDILPHYLYQQGELVG